jgi:hypothetical protein
LNPYVSEYYTGDKKGKLLSKFESSTAFLVQVNKGFVKGRTG